MERHSTVGEYQTGDCIGKGAFGVVYRGLNLGTGEVVAIKQFDLQRTSPSDIESLITEIKILTQLEHPNIVRYVDFVFTTSHLNLILEYVEQGSLLNLVTQFGHIPESLIATYVSQALAGLQYLHDHSVTHCDIKCANILVTKKGELKLTDFGVSRTFSKIESGSLAEEAVGTPYWMAPEIIELKGITPAADIWSLGCTVIELITGKPPYFELNPMSALFRIVQDICPPLPETISEDLSNFLKLCFQKDPLSRPSAESLIKHRFILTHKNDSSSESRKSSKHEESLVQLEKYIGGIKKSKSVTPAVIPEESGSENALYAFDSLFQMEGTTDNPSEKDLRNVFRAFAVKEIISHDDAVQAVRATGAVLEDVGSEKRKMNYNQFVAFREELKTLDGKAVCTALTDLGGSLSKSYLLKLCSSSQNRLSDQESREFSNFVTGLRNENVATIFPQ